MNVLEYFTCHKFSYYASKCYTKLPHEKKKAKRSNLTKMKEKEEMLLMIIQDNKKC